MAQEEYVVQAILGEKRVKTGKSRFEKKFLVKWKGWEEPTWEPEKYLANCQDKINAYRAKRSSSAHQEESKSEHDVYEFNVSAGD